MRLWSGTSPQFIEDTIRNQIAEKLKNSFFEHYRYYPSPAEINSWRNSLRAMSQTFESAELLDHGVMLEYQLPLTSRRLDCIICGKDRANEDHAVIVELKQWDRCEPSNSENEVVTWVGGRLREVLHPSVQVGQYQRYLEDTHTAFYDGKNPVRLNSCSYLHNYNYYSQDVIFDEKYREALSLYPLFTADDTSRLKDFLKGNLKNGQGIDVLKRVEKSTYRPSKKLMEHVGSLIKGKPEYILLDEQLIVYDKALACAKAGFHDKQRAVLLIKGGPGTGKSVIAINLMADLLLKGYNAHYATGSRAFTSTLRKIIGTRGSAQFKYFNSYGQAEENAVDVLISDEAHRIRKTSNSRFTKRARRSSLPQIDELIKASKVSVFFIDDNQVVRPDEIGSSTYIKQAAQQHSAKLFEYELESQFRCSGSDAFVNWVNNTLGIKRTANVIWDQHEVFDFQILDSPFVLEAAIREKVKQGFTGRLAAGFCWKWSLPNKDGTLKNDVVIGDFKKPWDAKPGASGLAPGIPKAELWAYDPNGINQVGCVYTAQGFEFDYVGVIFGRDLTYNLDTQSWEGHPEESADNAVKRGKEKFIDLVKNTYRVLLSRGLKGCYVYFMDKDTERFFKSRIEHGPATSKLVPSTDDFEGALDEFLKDLFAENDIPEHEKYVNYLPVYSLEAAASGFSEGQYVEPIGWKQIDLPKKLSKDYFIAKVVGRSMEPLIPNGSYCLFRLEKGGSRDGLVVLIESNRISDPENGQRYTVKRYKSEKELFDDGTWTHKKIILSPENQEFHPIELENVIPGDFQVIAEFISTI